MNKRPYLSALFFCLTMNAFGGQSLQNGFFLHEPAGVGLQIDNASLGTICESIDGSMAVCDKNNRLVVTGRETCTGDDRNEYPCTRYGYQYDYRGAAPGTEIRCTSTRNDGFNKRSMDYTLPLDSAEGSVFQPAWLPYEPVQRRVMLTEVHECSYDGEALTTIEIIASYEPGTAAGEMVSPGRGPHPDIDEPYVDTIPDASLYLTGAKAAWLMKESEIQEAKGEHIGDLWSHAAYTAIRDANKMVAVVFKFMLYDLYDIDRLSPEQLTFNVTFGSGGVPPSLRIDDLGKTSWTFQDRHRSMLMVLTGIQGPPGGARRPREFVAYYQLSDPDRSHARRIEALREYAEEHLADWHAGKWVPD